MAIKIYLVINYLLSNIVGYKRLKLMINVDILIVNAPVIMFKA